jgi:hypothetical protein
VYRADNLAAFGVGRLIAWTFLKRIDDKEQKAIQILKEKLKTDEGRADMTKKMAEALRDVFADNPTARKELEKAVDAFRDFQPIHNPPQILTRA